MLHNMLRQQAVEEIGLDGLCSAAGRDSICLTESVLGDFVPASLSSTIPPDSSVTDYTTEGHSLSARICLPESPL